MAGGKGKINEYNKSISAEKRKENARKAGSAPKKPIISDIRKIARMINDAPANVDLKNALAQLNIIDEDVANAAGIALAVYQAALNGNMSAVEKWERYVGQQETANENTNGKLADLIDGLKEPYDDIYTEAESLDALVANEPPKED